LEHREQEHIEVKAKVTQTARAFELVSMELAVTRPLLTSGEISEVELLRLQRHVANAQGQHQQALAQLSRTEAAVAEAESKLREVKLVVNNKWRLELSETLGILSSLSETSTGLADRIKFAEVRAQVNGTVQRLFINTLG